MTFFKFFDLIALTIALPVFLLASLPIAGYTVAAAAWLGQRALQVFLLRKAEKAEDARGLVGLLAGSMIARGWLVAIAVFLVGFKNDAAGLSAAVLVIALFTIYFTMHMITRPFEQSRVTS